MRIKVPQKEFIANLRFAGSCDYVHSCTFWLSANKRGTSGYKSWPEGRVNPQFRAQLSRCNKDVVTAYLKLDPENIREFFAVCKSVACKIILVSGCSDNSITKELFDSRPANIIKWYGENVAHRDKNLIPLPLGSLAGTWVGEGDDGAECSCHKDYELVKVDGRGPKFTNLVFMCFSIATNPQERSGVYSHFSDKSWVTNMCSHKTGQYLRDQEFLNMVFNHRFVVSPLGNGIDCGRTWLALQLGCIPIMPYHLCFEEWAKHLPIVLYRNINEITPQYLMSKLEEFNARDFSYEYLRTSYWKDRWEKDKVEISASAGS